MPTTDQIYPRIFKATPSLVGPEAFEYGFYAVVLVEDGRVHWRHPMPCNDNDKVDMSWFEKDLDSLLSAGDVEELKGDERATVRRRTDWALQYEGQ